MEEGWIQSGLEIGPLGSTFGIPSLPSLIVSWPSPAYFIQLFNLIYLKYAFFCWCCPKCGSIWSRFAIAGELKCLRSFGNTWCWSNALRNWRSFHERGQKRCMKVGRLKCVFCLEALFRCCFSLYCLRFVCKFNYSLIQFMCFTPHHTFPHPPFSGLSIFFYFGIISTRIRQPCVCLWASVLKIFTSN